MDYKHCTNICSTYYTMADWVLKPAVAKILKRPFCPFLSSFFFVSNRPWAAQHQAAHMWRSPKRNNGQSAYAFWHIFHSDSLNFDQIWVKSMMPSHRVQQIIMKYAARHASPQSLYYPKHWPDLVAVLLTPRFTRRIGLLRKCLPQVKMLLGRWPKIGQLLMCLPAAALFSLHLSFFCQFREFLSLFIVQEHSFHQFHGS